MAEDSTHDDPFFCPACGRQLFDKEIWALACPECGYILNEASILNEARSPYFIKCNDCLHKYKVRKTRKAWTVACPQCKGGPFVEEKGYLIVDQAIYMSCPDCGEQIQIIHIGDNICPHCFFVFSIIM